MEEFINIHFNGQLYLYMSNVIKKQNYDVYYSDIIDDEFFNLAYLKNNIQSLEEIYEHVKVDMKNLDRKPVLYITSNITDSKMQDAIEDLNFKLLYTDVWMTLDNLREFGIYKSKINFSLNKADKSLRDKFIKAVMNGFSGDDSEDPYGNLSDGYRIALEKSFEKNDSKYKVIHYLGLKEQESVSTATVIYRKDKAIIYNVTTNKKYQKQGVCKQMMSDIIKELIKLDIKEVCVQTEKGFYTEQVYKNMGFIEKMLGKAYEKEQITYSE